ncbi:MAG: DJ-1/PfpI family protein [Myxococcota bacterium]
MSNDSDLTIGILLFDDAEELDWTGPYEVFGMTLKTGQSGRLVTIAESMEPVRCFNGLRVLPDHDFANAPPLDLVLVPGGLGTREQVENKELIEWLAKTSADCRWITSVCTGSQLLNAAGLTRDKKMTTHWAFVETLRGEAPESTVLEGVRYVRDGRLVTAAGVSAGIDMSLWLVGQIWGIEQARNTQRMMEYDPSPPYGADV